MLLKTMLYILDEHLRPVHEPNFYEWSHWMFSPDAAGRRSIGYTTVGGATVSTAFLGIANGLDDPPLLFETMVFGPKHSYGCWRYATVEDARDGHREQVRKVLHGGPARPGLFEPDHPAPS